MMSVICKCELAQLLEMQKGVIMGQKEQIISLLKTNGALTQSALAESIYEDKNHSPNIYNALVGLVQKKIIIRTTSHPSYYHLPDIEFTMPIKESKKIFRDVSRDSITNDTIDDASNSVKNTDNYGPEIELVTRCLRKFPDNSDLDTVAMKIGLIDITNSTHLSQHKSRISMVELAEIISSIPNIDDRIKRGDPEVVNEIARSNGNINLFSFASKYCCYHNINVYGKDDYSILDTILKEYLPRYFDDITENQIKKWQNGFQYKEYNDYITKKLDEHQITVKNRKRKSDYYIWYKNRSSSGSK